MNRTPIPIPFTRRLAHWQSKVMPSLLFFCLCIAIAVLWKQNLSLPSLVGQVDIRRLDIRCLLYTSPSPRDAHESRMPSSA